jgi:dienelactone hydrolase
MPFELWYPAAPAHRGQDLDESSCDRFQVAPGFPARRQKAVRDARAAPGAWPVVLYFHGGYGDRRESTNLLTHLASHGYVVAAPAFAGDSFLDTLPGPGGEPAAMARTPVDESARRRPRQASSFLDALGSAPLPPDLRLDAARVAVAGYSLGGFTALAFQSTDRRASAAFALCPMYGRQSLLPQVRRLQGLLNVEDWGRPVPTLVLSGALDPMVRAEDLRDLHRRLAPPKRLIIVARAGHLHWTDQVAETHEQYRLGYLSGQFPDPEIDGVALGRAMRPISELCTEEQAGAAARAACLAHMDAFLRRDPLARDYLDRRLAPELGKRGVELEIAM